MAPLPCMHLLFRANILHLAASNTANIAWLDTIGSMKTISFRIQDGNIDLYCRSKYQIPEVGPLDFVLPAFGTQAAWLTPPSIWPASALDGVNQTGWREVGTFKSIPEVGLISDDKLIGVFLHFSSSFIEADFSLKLSCCHIWGKNGCKEAVDDISNKVWPINVDVMLPFHQAVLKSRTFLVRLVISGQQMWRWLFYPESLFAVQQSNIYQRKIWYSWSTLSVIQEGSIVFIDVKEVECIKFYMINFAVAAQMDWGISFRWKPFVFVTWRIFWKISGSNLAPSSASMSKWGQVICSAASSWSVWDGHLGHHGHYGHHGHFGHHGLHPAGPSEMQNTVGSRQKLEEPWYNDMWADKPPRKIHSKGECKLVSSICNHRFFSWHGLSNCQTPPFCRSYT